MVDWLEAGLDYRATTVVVNAYLAERRDDIVSRCTVTTHAKMIYPLVNIIPKRYQADKNKEAWQKSK